MMRTFAFAVGLLAALGAGTVARAETAAERLSRLEAETAVLADRVGVASDADPVLLAQASPLSPSLATDFEIRLQRLERVLSELTGRVEETNHAVGQLRDRVDRMNGDLDYRLGELEKGGGGGGGSARQPERPAPTAQASGGGQNQLGTLKPGSGAPTAATSNDPQKQYEAAFELLNKQDYDRAEKAFIDFIAKNKTHTLAGNAQYWLGETYFVRGRYAEAARTFAEGVQSYPKNNKAPDNLLKLGVTLAQLNQKNDACTALKQLGVRYPEASANIKRRAETEKRKLNCPA